MEAQISACSVSSEVPAVRLITNIIKCLSWI